MSSPKNTLQVTIDFTKVPFTGSDFVEELDGVRLRGQLKAIYDLMKDGTWRTLEEIELAFESRYGQASISAQLRNLRKKPLNMIVQKRRRGQREHGLFEYQLLKPIVT